MSLIQGLAQREALGRNKRRPGAMSEMEIGSKRQRTTNAEEGATQVGQGLQVTIPRAVPHNYNNNYTVRLTYADNIRHNVSMAAGSGNQIFRTTSIFDPDFTGVGHQPLMRDLWASMYDFYAVLACDYEIKMYNAYADPITYTAVGTSAQNIGTVQVTTIPTTNSLDITSSAFVYPAAETKNARTDWLPPDKTITIKGSLTPGDFIVDAKDSDSDQTWTAMGSNPTVDRLIGYHISSANNTSITGASEAPFALIQVLVILNYTVQFTQVNPSLRNTSS